MNATDEMITAAAIAIADAREARHGKPSIGRLDLVPYAYQETLKEEAAAAAAAILKEVQEILTAQEMQLNYLAQMVGVNATPIIGEADKIHQEGINAEGEINDLAIATFYSPCKGIIQAKEYIRIIQDGKGCDYETRVLNTRLIKAGWTPPNAEVTDANRSVN